MNKHTCILSAIIFTLCLSTGCTTEQWYKGNTHTHSLWSDGNDFPDMIAAWYKDHNYQFLVLSDHNVMSQGERWMADSRIIARGGPDAINRYSKRFGDKWVEKRQQNGKPETRLQPLDKVKQLLETPDQFILIPGEEITDRFGSVHIHTNAANLVEPISPQRGKSVTEVMRNNLLSVIEQSKKHNQPMMAHLNHPNFHYSITAEEIAAVAEERFFEVYNGHSGTNNLGDETHASTERIWDIANSIRIKAMHQPPLYGIASDDAHHYHGKSNVSITGRGWIMVKAKSLNPNHIINSLNQGHFYASSGVTLKNVSFDKSAGTLKIEIDPKDNVNYKIQFIGTMKDTDITGSPMTNKQGKPLIDANGKPLRLTKKYSENVGKILKTVNTTSGTYQFTGNELYVRAVIISDHPHPRPSEKNQVEKAWTQPVGWNKWIHKH